MSMLRPPVLKKVFFSLILSFCYFVVTPSHSTPQVYVKPQTMTVSHLNHPAISPFKELINQVYKDLNIEVRFYEVPGARGYLELNDGTVDADVVRIDTNARNYPNVLLAQPALYVGELVLICSYGLPCDQSALSNPDAVTISNFGNQMALQDLLVKGIVLNNEVFDFEDVRKMLNRGRADYAIYGVTERLKDLIDDEFNVVVLSTVTLHHVINKHHASLLPDIQAALEKHLLSFAPDTIF